MKWKVYMLLSSSGALYTGVAVDAEKRFYEHLEDSKKGAKFFRGNPPISLMYLEEQKNRSLAQKREYQIKKLSRKEKILLVEKYFQKLN